MAKKPTEPDLTGPNPDAPGVGLDAQGKLRVMTEEEALLDRAERDAFDKAFAEALSDNDTKLDLDKLSTEELEDLIAGLEESKGGQKSKKEE